MTKHFLSEGCSGPAPGVSPRAQGAGGNIPRRLIPSCFARSDTSPDAAGTRRSLVLVAVGLALSAAVGAGTGLILGHSPDRSVVIAPVEVPPPLNSGDAADRRAEPLPPSDVRSDTRQPLPRPSENAELFE